MAINVPIVSEFQPSGLKKAMAEFKRLETTSQKVAFGLKKAFLPATAALGGLAAAAVPAIKAASDLEEAQSKVNVIFGEGAEQVEAFAETAAKSIGQSKQSVLDAAGTFGTFGKAAGMAGPELAAFSNEFTMLASDMASFNNATPEEVIQARVMHRAQVGEGKDAAIRADDTPEALKIRLKEYHEKTAPLLKLFDEKKMLVKVDATSSIESVYKLILEALGLPSPSKTK